MYFKVIKDNKVIDVLDEIKYMKYYPRHDIMILCPLSEAQAILSSDANHVWHEETLYPIPVSGYDTVRLVQIDRYEYDHMKMLNGKTPEEIIDEYTISLIKEGVI